MTGLPELYRKDAGREIQLTDGIVALLKEEQVLAYRYHSIRYDCGPKLGYLEAILVYGLKHGELNSEFRQLLQQYPEIKP